MIELFDYLGNKAVSWVKYLWGISILLYQSLKAFFTSQKEGQRVVTDVIFRQILFTGVEALPVISFVALLLGAIVIVQSIAQFTKFGAEEYLGQVLVLVIIRELGPLLTAVIVIGRSATAIAIELGNMIVDHEMEALKVIGVDHLRFVVAPRIIGVTITVVCLTIYFCLVAIIGGFIVSRFIMVLPFGVFIEHLLSAATIGDIFVCFLKSAIFGLLIALICVFHGLSVKVSSTEVPQVTTRAVVSSIFFCFALNGIVTVLFYM
ncbi:MAG: ABC transporter permease [Deltaproteobacteria bacterium]|nr:MAG: ABC transporter permease [Deltaproteobacteria bacterium]